MDIKAVAIICLTLLEVTAMLTRTDGQLFLPLVAIIGGLAGYEIRKKKEELSQ